MARSAAMGRARLSRAAFSATGDARSFIRSMRWREKAKVLLYPKCEPLEGRLYYTTIVETLGTCSTGAFVAISSMTCPCQTLTDAPNAGVGPPVQIALTNENSCGPEGPGNNTATIAPVQYSTGQAIVTATDLRSDGFGGAWTIGRAYDAYATDNANGNHWDDTSLPHLVEPSDSDATIKAVTDPVRSYTMTEAAPETAYTDGDGNTDQPYCNATGGSMMVQSMVSFTPSVAPLGDTSPTQYDLVDSSGDQVIFYGFNTSIPALQRGEFKEMIDPAGNLTTTTYATTGDSLVPVGRIKTVTRTDGTETETFQYDYESTDSTAQIKDVKLLDGSSNVVEEVDYSYYTCAMTQPGNAGDLESATIKDASGTIGTNFYRYYTPWDETHLNGYPGDLMYVLSPTSYARAMAAGVDPSNPSADVSAYADNYFEYSALHFVTKEIAQGAGCTCSGSMGQGTWTFDYYGNVDDAAVAADNYNVWSTETVVNFKDFSGTTLYTNTVYSNFAGEVMLNLYTDYSDAGNPNLNDTSWGVFYKYDSQGFIEWTAEPSALNLPSDLGDLQDNDSVMDYDGTHYEYLNDHSGLIYIDDYYSGESTASESTAGTAAGYFEDQYVAQGQEDSSPVKLEEADYYSHSYTPPGSDVASTIFPVAHDTLYGAAASCDPRETTYAYTYHHDGDSVETNGFCTVETILPLISTDQNGPGGSANDTITDTYDTYGWLTEETDNGGSDTTYEYDDFSGAVIKTVVDPGGGGHLNLCTTYDVDELGRTTEETDPNGNKTYTVYDDADHQVEVFPGWCGTTQTTAGPVQISRTYYPAPDASSGQRTVYDEELTVDASDADYATSGDTTVPTGMAAISPADILSLTRSLTNNADQVYEVDAYATMSGISTYSQAVAQLGDPIVHTAPTTGNYYATTYGYNEEGLLNRTEEPTGTIDRTIYDNLGRVVSQYVGTDDTITVSPYYFTPATPGNLVDVEDDYYDTQAAPPGPSLSYSTDHLCTPENTTYYVKIAYDIGGVLTAASPEVSEFVPTGNVLDVAAPPVVPNETGYKVYASTSSGTETLQTSTYVSPGSGWEEDSGGLAGGGASPPDVLAGIDQAGDSNLTEVVDHVGGGQPDRVTQMAYDYRDRLVATETGMVSGDTSTHRPIVYNTYDNQDEVTAQQQFDGAGIVLASLGSTDGVPNQPSSSLLRAQTADSYDDQGRVFQTQVFSINQSSGAVGDALATNTFYDHRGDVWAVYSTASGATKFKYDAAGRVTVESQTDGGALDSATMDWSNACSVADDVVLSQMLYSYDGDSNVILTVDRERFDNDSTSAYGNLCGPSATTHASRDYYSADYYDAADRVTDSVDAGTDGGSVYSRPGSAPSGTSTLLVTHTDYDDAGNICDTFDPKGIETTYAYDLLGRVTEQVDAYDPAVDGGLPDGDANQTTDYTYDGNDDVLTMKAVLPSSTFQTTAYIYGIGSTSGTDLFSNDILQKIEYPNASTGAASSTATDDQVFTYDWQGEKTTFTDQNRTTHTYSYDPLGRETLDSIAVYSGNPAGINLDVKSLGYSYDTGGRLYQATSYSNANGTGVVNQVQYAYNGLGQETEEWQSHYGVVITSETPSVQYGYSSIDDGSRLTSMTYPNGRVEDYLYTGESGLDSAISRVSAIADDYDYTGGDDPLPVESYTYLGSDTIVQRAQGDGETLNYIGTPGGDGGDRYVGLDRFGRIVNQNWENSSHVSNEDFQYGYDQDGNVLYKNNVYAPTFSELYHANSGATGDDSSAYDGLGQLQAFRRGTLTSSGNNGAGLDTVTTGDLNTVASDDSATYSLDALGNRTSSDANSKNQITGDDYAYDHNGNMTVDATGNTFTYDAWNRLVTGSQLSADYSYDALGRRIGFDLASESLNNDWYYSADGHVIQEALCGSTIFDQYVWSLAGPNDLVLMDSNATDNTGDGYNLGKSGSSLGERIYIEQDANENVTALVGPTGGTALEHFIYDNYGAMQVMNGTYTATTTDAYNTVYLWQGERFDFATGLYHCGVRDERPSDGTWQEAEPAGGAYVDGMNLYQADGSNPETLSDPSGLGPAGAGPSTGTAGQMARQNAARMAALAAQDANVVGFVYIVEGYDENGNYQKYVGSTTQELESRITKDHPCGAAGMFKDKRTTVKIRKVYAKVNVAASGRGTLRSATNEALRSAEQGTMNEAGVVPRTDGVLNKNAAAAGTNLEEWANNHNVQVGEIEEFDVSRLRLQLNEASSCIAIFAWLENYTLGTLGRAKENHTTYGAQLKQDIYDEDLRKVKEDPVWNTPWGLWPNPNYTGAPRPPQA